MGEELYMVGVIVEDMARSVEFYRRLGVEIAEGSEAKSFVGVKMGGLTFFLSTKEMTHRWDPAYQDGSSGGYRILLEFYLKEREKVDAKYAEMVEYGYESHASPYISEFNNYFALVNDPDGNTILLSAEP